jgi:NCS1 family nucleobase:cation symporter-1
MNEDRRVSQVVEVSPLTVEKRGIDYVPPNERHGRPNQLLTFWGANNIQLVAFVYGAIAVSLGLDLKWSIATILIGTLFGGLFMAYHSVQGPRLGIPQMIQSRAQFGFYGAILPLVVVVAFYIAAFVLGIVVGGQALSVLAHTSPNLSMVISAALMMVATWLGYNFFHLIGRVSSVLSIIVFTFLTVKLLTMLPGHSVPDAHITASSVVLSISIYAAWQITWAPYVSDYSRYLPEKTSTSTTFWYTYIGSAVGACWVMMLGAVAATIATSATVSANGADYASHLLLPSAKWIILLILVLGIYASNYENLYGSFLTLVGALSPTGTFAPPKLLRICFTTVVAAIATLLAITASAHFLTFITNVFVLSLCALVPWTAINLTDYFLIRHGRYVTEEFFKVNGIYGRFNRAAVAIFVVTILIEIPFLSTAGYTGPIAKWLGGADISWILGLAIAAGLYYLVARRMTSTSELSVTPTTSSSGAADAAGSDS